MIVIYTTIFGGSDSLKPAPAGADRCVCFVDDISAYPDAKGWDLQEVRGVTNPRREAWGLRCMAHQAFPNATTVWVDASFTVLNLARLLRDADGAAVSALRHHDRRSCYEEGRELVRIGQSNQAGIERQLSHYKRAGFNAPHLSISCVLVRDQSIQAQRFSETWQQQIDRYHDDNTQVSLDYSAWVNGFAIQGLRGTRHENPYATHDHRDHKRRRKPYQTSTEAA